MTAFTFRHLDLRSAEQELVGACIDYEHALDYCARRLPADLFRSEAAGELRTIFLVLLSWQARGIYDEHENRRNLEVNFAAALIDELWSVSSWNRPYFQALTDALIAEYSAWDAAVGSISRLLFDAPLAAADQLEEDIYLRLLPAVIRRREERLAQQESGTSPVVARRPINWEAMHKRVHP